MKRYSPQYVVLDKTFIQGCDESNLSDIVHRGSRLVVTAELYSEVATCETSGIRARCFRLLHSFSEYIDLIDHFGTLLNYEIINHLPVTPLSNHFLQYKLNPNFNYDFNLGHQKQVDEFQDYIEVKSSVSFEQVVLELHAKFPRLKPKEIATNIEIVLEAYERLTRNYKLPPVSLLNSDWALFRRLQVDLIAAFEYMCSFKDGDFYISEMRKRHNQVDFRICIVGVLIKAIASKDILIQRYFNILCPDGTYISY